MSITRSVTKNFNYVKLVRLILLSCMMETLSTLFVQNRHITIEESGMSNGSEKSCDWVLKGKSLWRFLDA